MRIGHGRRAGINFSHGTLDEHRRTFARDPQRAAASGRPVAILADLQGPKLRVGPLPAPIELVKGEEVVPRRAGLGAPGDLELGFEIDFSKHLRRGRPVLINDGLSACACATRTASAAAAWSRSAAPSARTRA